MDDLEALRKKRLQELQEQQAAAQGQDPRADAAAQQAAQQEAAMESLLQQILEPEARERLTRIRMSRPDLADSVTRQLVAAAQQGHIRKRMTDTELRAILARLQPSGRDITITRK